MKTLSIQALSTNLKNRWGSGGCASSQGFHPCTPSLIGRVCHLNWFYKLMLAGAALQMSACSVSQPPPTNSLPSPIAPPTPVTTSPAPQPTVLGNPFQKGTDKATSARALAQDAQTPEDWNLVVIQWQRAIAFMKEVPRSDRNYASAQKLLTTYQQELGRAQQIAKRGGRSRSTVVVKDNSKGGIPLIVAAAGTDAPNAITTLNQQQIEFFTKQKRFAANLNELNSPISTDNPSFTYSTVGTGRSRAISTAIAKQDGLTSYIGAVFVVKDEKNNDTTVTIACVTAQPSKRPPALPQLEGKEAKCPAGSSKL